ncbi:MAG TPA: SCO family protein [Candidatus Baltobacteraceae bacterium]|jgi:protein SCO1/2|nr:SCO family protein [Candidatus Baltobacteraceae bacterium]
MTPSLRNLKRNAAKNRTRRWRMLSVIIVVVILSAMMVARNLLGNPGLQAADPRLIDDRGRVIALLGEPLQATVLYFGYTHCIDNCPLALEHLVHARHALDKNRRAIRIAFVTVDPERDTPPVLQKFVQRFGDGITGYTGDETQIETVLKDYHVWHQKIGEHPGTDAYLEAHSGGIFFVDASGHIRKIADDEDSVEVLESDMNAIVP